MDGTANVGEDVAQAWDAEVSKTATHPADGERPWN